MKLAWGSLLRKLWLKRGGVSYFYERFFALGLGGVEAVRSAAGALGTIRSPRVASAGSAVRKPIRLEFDVLERREVPTGGILETAIPTSASGPRGITAQGVSPFFWFTESSTNKVAKVDYLLGNVTEYTVPTTASSPWDITYGPDGNLWFTESATDKIAKVTTSGTFTEYALPTAGSAPHGITSALGALWFTESGRGYLGKITTTGTITEYNVGGQPENIVLGPDGNLWYTDYSANQIVKFTTGGVKTAYNVPTAASQPYGIVSAFGSLWFTEYGADKLGKVTTSGTFTEYTLTTGSAPRDIAFSDTDLALYFTQSGTNKIARADAAGTITEWAGLTAASVPDGIAVSTTAPHTVGFTENSGNKIGTASMFTAGSFLDTDPVQAAFVPFGDYSVSPQTGSVRAYIPLDLQARSSPDVFGSLPALVYNSNSVNVKPIVRTVLQTIDASDVPTTLDIQLTWNGSTQSAVTFTTTGHSASDFYGLADQVSSAVSTTGRYAWSLLGTATYFNGNVFTQRTSGTSDIYVSDTAIGFGYGWTLAGLDRLVAVTGGVEWVNGYGGVRYFSGSTTYTSPSNDFGSLVKNGGGDYTYTGVDKIVSSFDSSGYLTKQTDPHGLVRTFTYSSGRLTSITEPDGAVATFHYNGSNKLDLITAPGNRLTTITIDANGDLTNVTLPDGSLRTFTYDGSHKLTNDKLGLVNTTFAYSGNGALGTITLDQAENAYLKVAPANTVALNTTPAKNFSAQSGVLTDALGNVTTYLLDTLGRVTQLKTPDGSMQSWSVSSYGTPTSYTDARGFVTSSSLSGLNGKPTNTAYPDTARVTFTYDATYKDKLKTYEAPRSTVASPIITTYAYDAGNGDLLTETDPLGKITTYTWSSGLLQSVTDPLGRITTYQYSNRKLEAVIDPDLSRTTYLYDSAGNNTVIIDPLLNRTTYGYDAMRRVTSIEDPLEVATTFVYNANGLVTDQTEDGIRTTFAYDQRLQLISTTEDAGSLWAEPDYKYYDAVGNLTMSSDTTGDDMLYLYDAMGRVTQTEDPEGNLSKVYFDAAGNVTGVADIDNLLSQSVYDKLNRVTVTIDALSKRTTSLLDIAGNVTGMLDENNKLTTYLYDKLDRLTSTIDPTGRTSGVVFDAAGQVSSTLDGNGNRTTFLYDADGRRTVVIDALNNRTTSLYDVEGNLTGTLDARGKLTQYVNDAAGRATEVIDPLGKSSYTYFDNKGRVTGTRDANTGLTQYIFDGGGRLTVVIDPASGRVTTLYNLEDQVTGVLDARGKLTQYLLDEANRVTGTIDPVSGLSQSIYDTNGRVSVTVDPNGGRTTYLFDAANRTTGVQNAIAGLRSTYYDAVSRVTGVQDERGNWTTFSYDDAGRRINTYDGLGNRTTTLYDLAGNVTASIDANAKQTDYLYDALNRQTVVIDPLTYRTTLVFGPSGLLSMAYDKRGAITTYLYDDAGRKTVTIAPSLDRTTMLLDAVGNMTAVIDGNAHQTTNYFDALNRLTQTTDALTHSRYTYYDAAGNVTGVKDALNNWTTFAYDDAGRQVNAYDANGKRTTTLYDANGNVTASIDPLAQETKYLYDKLNRLTATIDALTYRTTNLYGAVGSLTYVKDASNNITTFAYDAANRKTLQTDPLGKFTTFLYDKAGLLTSVTNRNGQQVTYAYDADYRKTNEFWHNAGGTLVQTLTFTYDKNGNQLTAENTAGIYTMLYDSLNRVTSVNEFGKLLTMTYDKAGNRLTFETPVGTTTYTYDNGDNLSRTEFQATGYPTMRVDFAYNANDQLENVTRFSDLTGTTKVAYSTYLYDALNRITSQDDRKGSDNSALASYQYLYDADSRITSQTINGATNTFAYDVTDQLTGDGTSNFTFDATGNRNNGSYTTGTGNRTTNDGIYTYTYDDEGNLTKKSKGATLETWTFAYDVKNQMTSVEKRATDGGTLQLKVDLTYDAKGNRTKKEVDSNGDASIDTTEKFFYDMWKTGSGASVGNENSDVWADTDVSGTPLLLYLRGEKVDSLLARFGYGTSNAYWTLQDRQGSVRNVLDDTGVNKSTLGYDGYGVTTETDANYSGRYGYTGRERDVEIHLQYNRARYYDPGIGKWISQDPLGFDAGDSNLYRYVNNGTMNMGDPSGLFSKPPGQGTGNWGVGVGASAGSGDIPGMKKHVTMPEYVAPLGLLGLFASGNPMNGVASALGDVVGSTEWGTFSISQIARNGTLDPNELFSVPTTIFFFPNSKKVDATEVAFVQMVRITKGVDGKGPPSEDSYGDESKARMTKNGWTIDMQPGYPLGWYNYDKNGKAKATWGNVGDAKTTASLIDPPEANYGGVTWNFESYAIAKTGNQAGQVYGGVSWGFSVNQNLQVSLKRPTLLTAQTMDFKLTAKLWNDQSAPGFKGKRNSLGQVAFPDFKD